VGPTMPIAQGKPSVSVITIFLNAGRFIEEAIESVLAQTFTDWELLLVDDGSTDRSMAIARRYAECHPGKICYLEHPGHENHGMSASRNLGIKAARGDYVAFLDADDIWLPLRLERHVEILQSYPQVAMVYGPTLYWYSWSRGAGASSGLLDQTDFLGTLGLPVNVPIAPPEPLLSFLRTSGSTLPGICSLLARRKAVLQVGSCEEIFRGLYEDQVFLSKMCLNHTVLVLDEVLDYYRQHPDSCCSQAIGTGDYSSDKPHLARERYLSWLERYFTEQRVTDRGLWRALRKELRPYRHPKLHHLTQLPQLAVPRPVKSMLRRAVPDRVKWLLRAALPRSAYRWLQALAHH
jgi:glycosyltransferase involved in cell wall biosynthesis